MVSTTTIKARLGLAGFHFNRRDKLLFFGGALLISLTLFLLLLTTPTLTPTPTTLDPTFLLSCLHHSLSLGPTSFSFSPTPCGSHFKTLTRTHSLTLLTNSTVVFVGDSQCRLLLLSLLRLLLHPTALSATTADLFRRHSDYHTLIPSHSIALHFLWSPFESNISSVLKTLTLDRHPPDLLLAGSGLWHMLHVGNATDYGERLREIGRVGVGSRSRMFWVGMPVLVEGMLNTEEKRARMKGKVVEEYEREVERSGMLTRNGGPFGLLDVGLLSRKCGVECTQDGMHYVNVVYDAAVQVVMNVLALEQQS